MMFTFCSLIIAFALDRWLGEPKQWHPLVGFGKLASALENIFYSNTSSKKTFFIKTMFTKGVLAWTLAVMPIVLGIIFLQVIFFDQHSFQNTSQNTVLWILLNSIGLYFCIGAKSLEEHVLIIRDALLNNNLAAARNKLSHIVSRDTQNLDEQHIVSATIESTLENGSDAIFAALFWFVVGGLPAAVLYRLTNTLDAMWGYKNPRYFYFGKFAARMDDVMNFVPARLTALSYCLAGKFKTGWECWHQQGTTWKSPNAGPVMAAGAGALQITIGGDAIYHGKIEHKPQLGLGSKSEIKDINRAIQLIRNALFYWALIIFLLELLYVILQR